MANIFDTIGAIYGGAPNNATFQAQGTNILQPTTIGQAQQAYNTAQGGLNQDQALLSALQGQNGIGNQSAVYNQYQNIANGVGANPAQAMLNQATGQNVANQAALMAGQRGAASNPGLIARQAAQQGAATQQQAAGQGATLQAQQSLGALGQMGGLANQQVANQIGATQNLNQAAQSEQQNILNSINAQNQSNVSMQENINNTNEAMAASNAKTTSSALGGLFGGIGTALAGPLGGLAGEAISSILAPGQGSGSTADYGATSGGGTSNYNLTNSASPMATSPSLGVDTNFSFAHGGLIPKNKLESPQQAEKQSKTTFPTQMIVPPALAQFAEMYHGANFAYGGMPMEQGGDVPGKAEVKGDNKKNDTVPAMLSPGEVVIPRSVMESDDPVNGAAQFVKALQEKHGKKTNDHKAEFHEALKRAISGRKSK